LMMVLVQAGTDTGDLWSELSRPDNVFGGLEIVIHGSIAGSIVAAVLFVPVRATHRVHPALAFLWGPVFGAVVCALTVAANVLVNDPGMNLESVKWGRVAWFGTGTMVLAWPVYLALRQRGRGGWPALVVAGLCFPPSVWIGLLTL
ncbi:MAG: hypothetical protein AAF602_17005, partial [Myxococcota bacterium]